eukprot:6190996-Pleurochrysis_carterae.AAC.1
MFSSCLLLSKRARSRSNSFSSRSQSCSKRRTMLCWQQRCSKSRAARASRRSLRRAPRERTAPLSSGPMIGARSVRGKKKQRACNVAAAMWRGEDDRGREESEEGGKGSDSECSRGSSASRESGRGTHHTSASRH